MSFLIIFI